MFQVGDALLNPCYPMLTEDPRSALKEQSTQKLPRNRHASDFLKVHHLGPTQAPNGHLHGQSLPLKEPKALEGDKMEGLPQRPPTQPISNPNL